MENRNDEIKIESDRQTLRWPHDPHLLGITYLHIRPLPFLSVGEACDLFLTDGMWQKGQDVHT